jgi:hypothetical protein
VTAASTTELPQLTPGQRRGLQVLAYGHQIGRPVRSSNTTTDLGDPPPAHLTQLNVHTKVMDRLDELGLVERIDHYGYDFQLSAAGHEFLAVAP